MVDATSDRSYGRSYGGRRAEEERPAGLSPEPRRQRGVGGEAGALRGDGADAGRGEEQRGGDGADEAHLRRRATHTPAPTVSSFPADLRPDLHPDSAYGYRNNEWCSVTSDRPVVLETIHFDTESCCDKVTIGDRQYSGHSCPEGAVIEEGSSISWHSDGSVTRQGWEICSAE